MSEQINKKHKVNNDDSNNIDNQYLKDSESINDIKITLLEQKLYELQNINSDILLTSLQATNPDPLSIYTDPIINYEIAVLKKREEILIKKIIEYQQGDKEIIKDYSNPEVLLLKNEVEELKSNIKKSEDIIQSKDNIIKDLVLKLSDSKEHINELITDNDSLKSQIFLLTQLINQMQSQMQTQSVDEIPSFSDPVDEIPSFSDPVGNDSPVLAID